MLLIIIIIKRWYLNDGRLQQAYEICYKELPLAHKKTYRMTPQRKIILEELQKLNSHPSADEIYETVRKRIPRVSLGTVYRNLEILSEQGEIQKLELAGSMNRFDWDTNKHYHIRCMECGRIENAPLAPLNQIEDELYGATVFTIIGHRLEFVGLCPKCSEKTVISIESD